jgi:ribose 5-phosphate isomerase A
VRHSAFVPGSSDDPGVRAVAAQAVELIEDGACIGLGSGRAASLFIKMLGERIRDGISVSGVPTSNVVASLARKAGIAIIDLESAGMLDVTVDGADEVAPDLDLVKGWGGALVRERIVAAASATQVILASQDKLVRTLGERGRIPVEVIPLAVGLVARGLSQLGVVPTRRLDSGGLQPFVTENGNCIIDCALTKPLSNAIEARELEREILGLVGVVDTGLFLGTAGKVLVGYTDGRVETLLRPQTT